MKKILKAVLCILFTLFISVNLFVALICGPSPDATMRFLISAAAVSFLLPLFACGCVFFIAYLLNKINELEGRREGESGTMSGQSQQQYTKLPEEEQNDTKA